MMEVEWGVATRLNRFTGTMMHLHGAASVCAMGVVCIFEMAMSRASTTHVRNGVWGPVASSKGSNHTKWIAETCSTPLVAP